MIWVLVGVGIVVFGLVVIAVSRRQTPDGVATFQRQIDALSPEARRPVVQQLEDVVKGEPNPSEASEAPDANKPRGEGDIDGA